MSDRIPRQAVDIDSELKDMEGKRPLGFNGESKGKDIPEKPMDGCTVNRKPKDGAPGRLGWFHQD